MIGKEDAFAIVALACMTLLLVILISPFFEAALDDSWNFALPTKHFLETGVPVFDPFNSAASVIHIIWGGFFCLLFKFSFAVCRISNILLALVTSIILYFTLRQVSNNRKVAFCGAATFAANPIMMVTSYTYQSDIAYLALAFAATGYYLRYLKTKVYSHLLIATIIASLSVWNKLHGILLPMGALIYLLVARKEVGIKRTMWLPITIIPATSYLFFKLAKPIIHPISTTLDGKMAEFNLRVFSPEVWLADGVWRVFFIIVALGLYSTPFLAGWLFFRPKEDDDPPLWSKIVVALFWVAIIKAGFLFLDHGIGYPDANGVYPFHSSMLREAPAMAQTWGHYLLSWLAWPTGAFLGYHLTWAAVDSIKKRDVGLLLFGLVVPQILILVPIKLFMDRYFLVLFPLVFIILARRFFDARFHLWVTLVLVAFSFILGGARISQYTSANMAQWQGAEVLTDKGVSTLNIDAGYAWTGWHNYEHSLANPHIDYSEPGDHWYIYELCKTTRVKYLVTFWPPSKEIEILDTVEYIHWFSTEPAKVYIWEKPESFEVDFGKANNKLP